MTKKSMCSESKLAEHKMIIHKEKEKGAEKNPDFSMKNSQKTD